MKARFCTLASGSGGNASVVQIGDTALLIDIGLGPRVLASRMAAVGLSWSHIRAVVLTHTHGDHWKETTLAHLFRRQIPLYCHADHHARLGAYSSIFASFRTSGLLCEYQRDQEFTPIPKVHCQALAISHDSRPTFGFVMEGEPTLFGPGWRLGYLSDLGVWDDELVERAAGLDLLALEFNHDVVMEKRSGRTRRHIDRVLGPLGHLSNDQASSFLSKHLETDSQRLRHVVQLHLSGDCNLPALAIDAARRVLNEYDSSARIHTAAQDQPLSMIAIEGESTRSTSPARRAPKRKSKPAHPLLPGFETE